MHRLVCADIIEDLYSPRTASMDFVSELVRKRGKENLHTFLQFIVEIFKRYLLVGYANERYIVVLGVG